MPQVSDKDVPDLDPCTIGQLQFTTWFLHFQLFQYRPSAAPKPDHLFPTANGQRPKKILRTHTCTSVDALKRCMPTGTGRTRHLTSGGSEPRSF
ncbi:hypothetical protein RJ55_00484 [Drechmeria coniospora]|nr:hypothetical protein RJ55_00484 [Drechmeria coniospora]